MHGINRNHVSMFNGIDFKNVMIVYKSASDYISLDKIGSALGLSNQTICGWQSNKKAGTINKCQTISVLLYIVYTLKNRLNDNITEDMLEELNKAYAAFYKINHPDKEFVSFKDILDELMMFD